jgi:hypothetical protein
MIDARRFGPDLRARLTTPEHVMMMDTIEANLVGWVGRFTDYEGQNSGAAIEAIEQGGQTARVLITLKATQIARRVVGLTEGFITLANQDNVSAAPAVVRALHETACVSCYMAEEIVPRLKKGRITDVHRLLWRLGLGTNHAAGFGEIRPIQPGSLNRAAERWMTAHLPDAEDPAAVIEMMYGPLSDQTHPSFGAFAAGTDLGADGVPEHVLRPPFDGDSIDKLLSSTFMALLIAGEALDGVIAVTNDIPMTFPPGAPQWQDGDLHARDAENDGAAPASD